MWHWAQSVETFEKRKTRGKTKAPAFNIMDFSSVNSEVRASLVPALIVPYTDTVTAQSLHFRFSLNRKIISITES